MAGRWYLNPGTLHTILPLGFNWGDSCVGQRFIPSAETVCLSHFLPQAQLLKELEHRVAQEALHRQQLDLMKASSMEKLLKDVQQKEQHLQLLTEDAKRASKLGQLQQKKIQRELRQVTPVRGSKSGRTSQSGFHLVLSTPLLPPQWYSLPRSLPGTAGKWKYLYLGDCSSCLWAKMMAWVPWGPESWHLCHPLGKHISTWL